MQPDISEGVKMKKRQPLSSVFALELPSFYLSCNTLMFIGGLLSSLLFHQNILTLLLSSEWSGYGIKDTYGHDY